MRSMAEPAAPSGRSYPEHPPIEPLREGERPAAMLVAVVVCAVLSLGVIAGALTITDLSRHGGSLPGALFIAAVLASLASGMYRSRYWAVLGFQALLTFQIVVTSLALVVASSWVAAAGCLASVALGAWLFWKLVRVLSRISARDREAPRTGER
jgi:hypothetical protein